MQSYGIFLKLPNFFPTFCILIFKKSSFKAEKGAANAKNNQISYRFAGFSNKREYLCRKNNRE